MSDNPPPKPAIAAVRTALASIASWPRPVAAIVIAVTVITAGGATAGVVHAVDSGPTRSAAAFCGVYQQQKAQYLARYANNTTQSTDLTGVIATVGQSLAAMGDWVVIFDHLDKVAPDDIEPDVARVRDSIKSQEEGAASSAANPISSLASGLATGLMASGSWQRVSDYIGAHCDGGAKASETAASDAAVLGHGLLVGNCSAGSTVSLVDPDTGAVRGTATVTLPADGPVTVAEQVCTPKTLSPDHTKRATTQTFPDGSVHAGFKDVATGTFRDVAAPLHPTGFGDTPTKDAPGFFDAAGALHFTAASGTTYVATPPDYQPHPSSDEGTWSPHHVTEMMDTGDGQVALKLSDGKQQPPPPSIPGASPGTLPANYGVLQIGGPNTPCTGAVWVTDTLLMCATGQDNIGQAQIVDIGSAQVTQQADPTCAMFPDDCYSPFVWSLPTSARRDVLPSNPRDNASFVPSPDGTRIAFLSTQNNDSSLYTIGVTPGSQPTLIPTGGVDLTGAKVIGWR